MLQTGCKQVVYPVGNLEPQHSYTRPSCVCTLHIPVICKDGFLKKNYYYVIYLTLIIHYFWEMWTVQGGVGI